MLSFPGAVAQEAAYAIWNLTVGHEKNSDAIARLGAVPKLAELLKSTSDIAQENAAGALMHITISQDLGNLWGTWVGMDGLEHEFCLFLDVGNHHPN